MNHISNSIIDLDLMITNLIYRYILYIFELYLYVHIVLELSLEEYIWSVLYISCGTNEFLKFFKALLNLKNKTVLKLMLNIFLNFLICDLIQST